jgi:hypothetical protein
MSNFYAKAINPRTHQEEDCTFIDTGKDTFIEFKDGWKYNTKFFNSPISEQEAINQDGEETIEEFELYFGKPSTGKEILATLGVSLFMTGLLAVLIVGVVNCVQIAWRVIERVI